MARNASMPGPCRESSAAKIPLRHRRDACAGRAPAAAFTIVELVVALAIATLLAILGVPVFQDWLAAYELTNHAKHLAETMTRARTEAVRRGHRVNLCKSTNGGSCADHGTWDAGFLVYVDQNGDGKIDAGEPVLEIGGAAPRGITISANRPVDDYVSYTSLGRARMLSGALQMGTFTFCRSGQRAMQVVLANSGRVRVEKGSTRCP